MKAIIVTFPGGKRVDAMVGDHTVHTDQPPELGGDGSAPDPFSLFLASLATCAGFYVHSFCAARGIPMTDIQLTQESFFNAEKRLERVALTIRLPRGFPEQYVAAIRAAAGSCKVKKALANPPEITIESRWAE